MRFVTLALDPADGAIHPVGRLLAAEPVVTRERLIHVGALSSGDGILFYRLRGDADAVAAELDRHERVREFDIHYEDDDAFHAYVYVNPGEPAGTLMGLVDRYALVVDTPLEFEDDGCLVVTVAGRQHLLQEAIQDIPASVDWEILRAGDYDPDTGGTATGLTARQREVMETAVELGYYEVPRRATHTDIAAEFDCTTSTIDEHLRKAESRVLSSLWGEPTTP